MADRPTAPSISIGPHGSNSQAGGFCIGCHLETQSSVSDERWRRPRSVRTSATSPRPIAIDYPQRGLGLRQMKAHHLVHSAAYGPETLKILFKAFDDAWDEVKPTVSKRPRAIEAARLRLANILLSLVKEDSRDPTQLKNEAIQILLLRRQISN